LFTVNAETKGEFDYALAYVRANPDVIAATNSKEDRS
jgi:hypothetical protein